MIRRFKREGLVISKLSHPNIVTVLIMYPARAYIWSWNTCGLTLRVFLDDRDCGRAQCIVGLIKQVVSALEHPMQLIIHRDIKPANIFLIQTEMMFIR